MRTPAIQPDKISLSDGLIDFLKEQNASFIFTSYDAGSVYFIGQTEGKLSLNFIRIGRAMGVSYDGRFVWVAGRTHLYRFANQLPDGQTDNGHDRIYYPRTHYLTGDLDIHEISNDAGRIMFAATRYSCIGGLTDEKSFEVLWKPEWISKIVPEDRCHLNGLFVEKGKPRLVSVIGKSDSLQGWRGHRESGGFVYDLTEDVFGTGYSMPHSPRRFDKRTWVLDSGRGLLESRGEKIGEFYRYIFCPGFLRGLSFLGRFTPYALVTVSLPRDGIFKGLPLQTELEKRGGEAWCAVLIIDIERGAIVHWLRIEGPTRELFDCCWLPGVLCPGAKAPGDPALASRVTF